MVDLICVTATECSSFDRNEDTTYGYQVQVQIGPIVLEFWVTKRPKQEKAI